MLAPVTIPACHLCGKVIPKGVSIMVAAGTKPRRLAHTACPVSSVRSEPYTAEEAALLMELVREHEAAEPKAVDPLERFPFEHEGGGVWRRKFDHRPRPARLFGREALVAFAEFIADAPADPGAWTPSIHKGM